LDELSVGPDIRVVTSPLALKPIIGGVESANESTPSGKLADAPAVERSSA
jgi:hypothetical protein